MHTWSRYDVLRAAVLVGVLMLATACGGDAAVSTDADATETAPEVATGADTEPAAAAATPGAVGSASPEGAVTVLLGEWVVEPNPTTVAAGDVTFLADDQGGEVESHYAEGMSTTFTVTG